MKVLGITLTHFKNLEQVQINPEGKSVYVTGGNGQGKTSLIQSVFSTLGAEAGPKKAIMDGFDKAKVVIRIGDKDKEIFVEKSFTPGAPNGKLLIKTDDGATYGKPVEYLEKLIGNVNFDMERFLLLKNEKEMLKFLKEFLNINTDDLDMAYDAAYKKRAELNKAVKEIEGSLLAYADIVEPYEKPEDVSSLNELAKTRENARNEIRDIEARIKLRESEKQIAELKVSQLTEEETRLLGILEKLRADIKENTDIVVEKEKAIQTGTDLKAEKEQAYKKLEDPTEKLNAYADNFAKYQRSVAKNDVLTALDKATTSANEANDLVVELAQKRASVFEGKNIAGLTITEDGIIFNGLPLVREQINTAKLAELAVDIIIAVNPNLKIVKFDATMMDTNTFKGLMKRIEDAGFQAFIEEVDKVGQELTIQVLEQGQL